MSANEEGDIEMGRRALTRGLHVEGLENRNLLAADFDDAMGEAQPLGPATQQGAEVAAEISTNMDVDMYSLAIGSGQTVDIDVDTPLNGEGGLGAHMRLFNDQGVQIAANNDDAAPGEGMIGFDPYLRFTAGQGGIFYIGISSYQNTAYDPLTGEGDSSTEQHATGVYTLRVTALPEFQTSDGNVVPNNLDNSGQVEDQMLSSNMAAPMVESPNALNTGMMSGSTQVGVSTSNSLGGSSILGSSISGSSISGSSISGSSSPGSSSPGNGGIGLGNSLSVGSNGLGSSGLAGGSTGLNRASMTSGTSMVGLNAESSSNDGLGVGGLSASLGMANNSLLSMATFDASRDTWAPDAGATDDEVVDPEFAQAADMALVGMRW